MSCEHDTSARCSPTVAASESARTEIMACGFLDSKAIAGHSWAEEITPAQNKTFTVFGRLPGAVLVQTKHMKGGKSIATVTMWDQVVCTRQYMSAMRLLMWHACYLLT